MASEITTVQKSLLWNAVLITASPARKLPCTLGCAFPCASLLPLGLERTVRKRCVGNIGASPSVLPLAASAVTFDVGHRSSHDSPPRQLERKRKAEGGADGQAGAGVWHAAVPGRRP